LRQLERRESIEYSPDPFFGLDPAWTEAFFAAVAPVYIGNVLSPKLAEFLSIAGDASNAHVRTAMTMATSVRNVGVSMVIATGSFAGTKTVTAATAFAIFQTIVMALVALGWSQLLAAPPGTTRIEGLVIEGVLHGKLS
jgi:hypothetical protein